MIRRRCSTMPTAAFVVSHFISFVVSYAAPLLIFKEGCAVAMCVGGVVCSLQQPYSWCRIPLLHSLSF